MNDEQLKALVAQLDALVPREGAYFADDHGFYGSEHDPGYTGNRLGYLRFGIELLKVADAPHSPGYPDLVKVDLSYLSDADIRPGDLAIFERREISPDRRLRYGQAPMGVLKVAKGFVGFVLLILIGVALVLGILDMFRWLWPPQAAA